MVVVGNPAVLVHDPCWAALLRSAVQLNAYTGTAPLPPEVLPQQGSSTAGSGSSGQQVDDLAALLARMEGLSLSGEGGSGGSAGAAAAWRGSAVDIEGGAMRRLDE